MNKKGSGHLEIIISVILFIFFVSTALILVKPTDVTILDDTSVRYASNSLKIAASEVVDEYSIVVYPSVKEKADPTKLIVELEGLSSILDANIGTEIVLNNKSSSDVIEYGVSGDNVVLERVLGWYEADDKPQFFYLRIGKMFPPTSGLAVPGTVDERHYNVTTIKSFTLYSENLLKEINTSYYEDYNGLKNSLNIPLNINFGFIILDRDQNVLIRSTREAPAGVDVFSERRRIRIYRTSGDLEFGDLIVRTW